SWPPLQNGGQAMGRTCDLTFPCCCITDHALAEKLIPRNEQGPGYPPGLSRLPTKPVCAKKGYRVRRQPSGARNRVRHNGPHRFETVEVLVDPTALAGGQRQGLFTGRGQLFQVPMGIAK